MCHGAPARAQSALSENAARSAEPLDHVGRWEDEQFVLDRQARHQICRHAGLGHAAARRRSLVDGRIPAETAGNGRQNIARLREQSSARSLFRERARRKRRLARRRARRLFALPRARTAAPREAAAFRSLLGLTRISLRAARRHYATTPAASGMMPPIVAEFDETDCDSSRMPISPSSRRKPGQRRRRASRDARTRPRMASRLPDDGVPACTAATPAARSPLYPGWPGSMRPISRAAHVVATGLRDDDAGGAIMALIASA